MASKKTNRRALVRARADRQRYQEERQVHDHPLVLPNSRKLPENPTREDIAKLFAAEVAWINKARRR